MLLYIGIDHIWEFGGDWRDIFRGWIALEQGSAADGGPWSFVAKKRSSGSLRNSSG
jgi:hypothetical protein